MSKPAIIIEGLSKAYRIGHQFERYPTFREAIVRTLTGPLRRFRQLRAGGFGGGDREETFWALKDVSFEVRPGEVVGIIGRNGAGKSTLLKILSRITEPTEGRAILHGRVASLLEVGTGFHPELTGRENIYLNGAILGMKKAEIARKFDEIVAFAEIEKFLDTPVKRYSSGMYVRLAFAVAAHLEPEILIVDEVLAVGDAEFQKKCLGKMQEVSRGQGRTVLFVSHNMGAVERLCNRAVLLVEGQAKAPGDTRDIIAAYIRSAASEMVEWKRSKPYPCHPHFRSAWLCNVDGTVCHEPTSGGCLGLAVEFCLPTNTEGLIVGVAVCDDFDHPIFASSPIDSGHVMPHRAGCYRTVMMFPEAILMPKRYRLRLVLYAPQKFFDAQPDAIAFQVQETSSLVNSIPGGRVGDVQILCDWSSCVSVNDSKVWEG